MDRNVLEGRSTKIAIECGDERVSYQQLLERTNRGGNAFRRLGMRREERVLLLLLDTPEFLYCFFGAIKIGAAPVPTNTLLKPDEYEYVLKDSRAGVVVVSEALTATGGSNTTGKAQLFTRDRCSRGTGPAPPFFDGSDGFCVSATDARTDQ